MLNVKKGCWSMSETYTQANVFFFLPPAVPVIPPWAPVPAVPAAPAPRVPEARTAPFRVFLVFGSVIDRVGISLDVLIGLEVLVSLVPVPRLRLLVVLGVRERSDQRLGWRGGDGERVGVLLRDGCGLGLEGHQGCHEDDRGCGLELHCS